MRFDFEDLVSRIIGFAVSAAILVALIGAYFYFAGPNLLRKAAVPATFERPISDISSKGPAAPNGFDAVVPRDIAAKFSKDVFARYGAPAVPTSASLGPEDADDPRTVGLLYASTRKPVSGHSVELSDERNPDLVFGVTRVRVPEAHHVGAIERPWEVGLFGWTIYKAGEDDKQHFVIKANRRLTRPEFLSAVKSSSSDEALVFVHGFNNKFDESAFRLAQMVWDTNFTGVPVLFSWPSRGGILNYGYDTASATFSRRGFLELLQTLQADTQLKAIHVVAHSMGNQIVVEALANMAAGTLSRPLAEVILAAPDVDRDVFTDLAGRIRKVARGVTLYASSADKALVASRTLAGGVPRAGDVPAPPQEPVILPELDTIDVSVFGEEFLGLNHDTFAANRIVMEDFSRLLREGRRPPNLRMGQIRGVPEGVNPPRYWRYPQ
jgi:esterase/lipase superfamily enzyme